MCRQVTLGGVIALTVTACTSPSQRQDPSPLDATTNTADAAACLESQKVRLYPDLDKDGFGDARSPGMLLCGLTPGYLVDHSDCVDSDANAHPGAAYSSTPIANAPLGQPAWDFNCDGIESPAWTAVAPSQCSQLPPGCLMYWPNGGAWRPNPAGVPACGVSLVWVTGCNAPGTSSSPCREMPSSVPRVQACN